jgi:predicted PurR-regulated permease PerM
MTSAGSDRERLSRVLFYGIVLLVGWLAYRILQPFLMPLAWAGVLAVAVHPLFLRAERRWGANRAAWLTSAAVALVLLLPGAFLATALVDEASKAVTAIQTAVQDVEKQEKAARALAWAQEHLPLPSQEEMKARLLSLASRVTGLVAGQAGAIVRGTSVFFFKLFLTLFALYFLLRDSIRIGPAIRRLLPFETERNDALLSQTRDLIHAGTTTTLTIAAAQGLAGGVIFAILGIDAPVLWGTVMAFCSLLPVVGSALVWAPAAAGLALTGHWIAGVVLAGLGIGVIGMIDNFLRPLLMSGRSSMNGLLIFLSLLGGISAFGFIGLVLGPAVAAAAIALLRALPPRPPG